MTRLIAALCALLFALPALAETRLALVMGNAAYENAPLANPANDARLTSAALRDAGFDVAEVIDGNREAMKRAARDFAQRIKAAGPGAAAVFYFAGHGVQVEGRNYLIPVGAPIESAADLDYEAVEAQWVLDLVGEAGAGLSVFILDACRNNPFRSLSRAASRGLARMDAPRGSILSYSTAPGDVALDGTDGNSPYTKALAAAIRTPGLKLEEAFKSVRVAVLDETSGRQTPWESSSLTGDFFFTPGAGGAPQPAFAAPSRKPGERFRDCPACPEMIARAGGRATIGSTAAEAGHEGHEAPPTPVSLAPYALSAREITVGEFARFAQATGHRTADGCWVIALVWVFDKARSWRDPGHPQSDAHPVSCVRYSDAVAYADWLSAQSGVRYRLPSEAEWEAAAAPAPWRGGPPGACDYGNVHDRTANETFASGLVLAMAECHDGFAATAKVASYKPHAEGFFDLFGNASEWTADCWNGGHRGLGADGRARRDGDCAHRVVKGASFLTPATGVRPAWRFRSKAEDPNVYTGFRLARDLN